jgi:hypothetical protein
MSVMEEVLARLISTILSKGFLKVKQIKNCMSSANDEELRQRIEEQNRYIKQLQEEIHKLERMQPVPDNSLEDVSQDSTSDPMDVQKVVKERQRKRKHSDIAMNLLLY